MNAPDKLAVGRRAFIGGSDAAAIIQRSAWATPLDVYFEKRGETPLNTEGRNRELQDLLESGKEFEPIIVKRVERLYGIKIVKRSTPENPNRYVDPERAFLSAEVDFEWEVQQADIDRWDLPQDLLGTVQNGEAKSHFWFVMRGARAKYGEEGTEEIPIEYAAQAAHGQMVTGRRLTMVAVMEGKSQPLIYWYRRDEETIAGLRKMEVDFWNNNVLAGVPPEPLNYEDVENLFPRDRALGIEANEETFKLVCEMDVAKAQKAAAESRIEELKYEIGKFMIGADSFEYDSKKHGYRPTPNAKPGKHELVYGGTPLLTIGLQSQTRIDSDAVREKHPAVAIECGKNVRFFRFDKPRKPK